MNKRVLSVFSALVLMIIGAYNAHAQKIGVKNNLLYDAAMVPNIGAEFSMGKKTTLDAIYAYHPFSHNHVNRKWKGWMVQPELRFWSCDVFNGFFWGIHAHGGEFNFGKVYVPFILNGKKADMMAHRYEGYYYGGGLSIGYQWVLSNHLNLELSIGAGYAHLVYDKFDCATCGAKVGDGNADYIGPTKATLSLIYMLK